MSGLITAAVVVGGTAYMGAKDANKQAKAQAKENSKPTTWSNTTTPYSPWQPNLDALQQGSLANYQYQRDNAAPPPRRSSGGSTSQVSGSSGLENQLAESAGARAMGTNQLLDSASGSLQNLYGGGSNPLLQGAYNSAQNFTNPYLNEQVARQQRGSGSRASGLLEGLYGEWAGAGAMNAGNQAYNQYYTQGEQAPTNLQGGGDIFGGMTSSGQGGGGGITSAGQWSRSGVGGGGNSGGGGQAGPRSALQEAYDAEMLKTMQGQYQNADSNPYLQQQIDQAKRDADAALAARNQQLGAMGDGLGRFGSSPYMAMQKNNEALYNQEYLDRAGDLRFENYGMERGIMQQALDRMLNQNTAEMQDRTARAGISASSRGQQDSIASQERMARDANKLGALGLLGQMEGQNQGFLGDLLGTQTQAGLSALGIQGQLGTAAAGNQVSALGLAPQTSDAYYTGYGVAGGLAGQVRQGNQAAQSANQAAQQAAANARYQDDMAAWQWQQQHEYDNLANLYNLTMGPAATFGTQSGQQQGPAQIPKTVNPWVAGLGAAAGTYLQGAGGGMGMGQNANSGGGSGGAW